MSNTNNSIKKCLNIIYRQGCTLTTTLPTHFKESSATIFDHTYTPAILQNKWNVFYYVLHDLTVYHAIIIIINLHFKEPIDNIIIKNTKKFLRHLSNLENLVDNYFRNANQYDRFHKY